MILGALIGDYVGSRFEFDKGPWIKDFEFFEPSCEVTDDSYMTLAVAQALLLVGKYPTERDVKESVTTQMQLWGKAFPDAGYGANFRIWLQSENPQPYYSFGNGAAMRTSAVGWLYDDLETTRKVSRWVSEVSHDHPEGIKGAECISTMIWMARNKYTRLQMVETAVDEFGYDLSKSVSELIPLHCHNESCMDSVPKAIIAFYESYNFEDAIRNAVAMGGDTDTIAAITGSIAEAFYSIPLDTRIAYLERLPKFISRCAMNIDVY